jgi:exopolysaccharide production protein ExoZ
MKQFLSIQYLRALAALSVVLFHEAENSGYSFPVGQAGVDLFFVISGFIICVVTESKEADPSRFFWRRLARIVPLYWCATFLTVIICLIRPHLLWGVDISFYHVAASLFLSHKRVYSDLTCLRFFKGGL